MSSCGGGLVVCPGGGLVVAGVGLEAAVQDADQAVPELAQGCVVTDPAPAQGVVVGAGTGELVRAQKAHWWIASPKRRLRA